MKKILFFIAVLLSCLYIQAQEELYMTGLLPDDGTYEQLPRKAELLTRDYTVLPSKHSLMQYCPNVKSQSRYGTCTSWATAYAARTIAEAVKHGWTDKDKITSEAFSPLFVYALVKDRTKYPNDDDCQEGILSAELPTRWKSVAKVRKNMMLAMKQQHNFFYIRRFLLFCIFFVNLHLN